MKRRGTLWRIAAMSVAAAAVTLFAAGASVAHAAEWNEREAVGVSKPDDALFPETIERGGELHERERVAWAERVVTARSAPYSLEYDFGTQVEAIDPPRTVVTTYFDRITGANVEATLAYSHMEILDGSTLEREEEVFAHSSWDSVGYELADGTFVRFDAERPSIATGDVATSVLQALHYDPDLYHLVSSSWLGQRTEADGKYTREALYIVERRGVGQRAIYRGDVPLPDAIVYDGLATYATDPVSTDEATRPGSPPSAMGDEPIEANDPVAKEPRKLPLPLLIGAAAPAGGVLAGVSLARKRRREEAASAGREFPFMDDPIVDGRSPDPDPLEGDEE